MVRYFIAVATIVLFSIGCSKDDPGPTGPPPNPDSVSFSSDVLPLFNSKGCVTCHGGSGGLTVTSVAALMTGGDHGPAIVAGNADGSILIQKLNANPPFGARMPQGGPFLSTTEIDLIKRWINQGALNN